MLHTHLRRFALATLTAMALLLIAAPAFAHHKDGHDGGKAESTTTTTVVTEDNDDDGAIDYENTPDPAGDTDNAHPSGNDKSAENGGSVNQGSADSTPDQNGNGPERDHEGTDKPGGAGGADKLDQDGNNGCGNDDDFEDDNEGNCGGKGKTKPPKPPKPPKDTPKPPKTDDNPKGDDLPKPPKDDTPVVPTGTPGGTPPTVLSDGGASATGNAGNDPASRRGGNEAAPVVALGADELPFTGVNATTLVILMLALGLLGAAFAYAGRRTNRV